MVSPTFGSPLVSCVYHGKSGYGHYETHLGGEFDATNIIKTPLVTAITTITEDHVKLLGPKIQDIAWHKAGILKLGALAFSTLQDMAVTRVLQQRASEKKTELHFIGVDSTLPTDMIALKPKVQRANCSLVLAVVRAWLSLMAPKGQSSIDDDINLGIEQFSWPGRYQQINERNCQWFLDRAHNELSLRYAVEWLVEVTKSQK
jgi:folylpolyglutamate synthase